MERDKQVVSCEYIPKAEALKKLSLESALWSKYLEQMRQVEMQAAAMDGDQNG